MYIGKYPSYHFFLLLKNNENILLKNFYQCSFCKQVFAKNHQQLKVHMKKFHKIDFVIKSNELIEEIVSKKKKLKVLIRKLDDSLINEILSKKNEAETSSNL